MKKYDPSGEFSLRLIPAVLLGCLLMVALTWGYQKLLPWVPWALLRVAISGFWATSGAGILFKTLGWGNCRSRPLGIATGVFISTVALAAGHQFAYWNAVDAAASTVTFFEYLESVAWNVGWFDTEISGGLVYLIYLLEAIFLTGLTLFGVSRINDPFCEECGVWVETERDIFDVVGPAHVAVERLSEGASLDALIDPLSGGPRDTSILHYDTRSCPCRSREVYVRVERTPNDGTKPKTVPLLPWVRLNAEETELYRAFVVEAIGPKRNR